MRKILLLIFLVSATFVTEQPFIESLLNKSFNTCSADTIYLKDSRASVDLKIKKVTKEYVIATVQKYLVDKINLNPDSNNIFSDVVYFKTNPQNRISCKIMGITNKVYALKLSMHDIDSLEMNNKGEGSTNKQNQTQNMIQQPKRDSYGTSPMDELNYGSTNYQPTNNNGLMRESLDGDESLSSAPKQNKEFSEMDAQSFKEEIKRELLEAMNKNEAVKEEAYLKENTGVVRGRLLKKGDPFPNCAVQIISLSHERILFMKTLKKGTQLETITDEYGFYVFDEVPPGNYKLYWKPDYAKSWIRKMKMEPDMNVLPGRTTTVKDLEINKRVMN